MARAIALLLAFLGAARASSDPKPALDVILLLESGQALRTVLSTTRLPAFATGDRFALVTFEHNSRVRERFTHDPRRVESALERLTLGFPRIPVFLPGRSLSPVRVLAAVLEAARLFDGLPAEPHRRRALVVLFGSDDFSQAPGGAELISTLHRAGAALFPIAVRKRQMPDPDPRTETPPTIPGRTPPVRTDLAPPPEAAMRVLSEVARQTGGATVTGPWDLLAVLARVRNH